MRNDLNAERGVRNAECRGEFETGGLPDVQKPARKQGRYAQRGAAAQLRRSDMLVAHSRKPHLAPEERHYSAAPPELQFLFEPNLPTCRSSGASTLVLNVEHMALAYARASARSASAA